MGQAYRDTDIAIIGMSCRFPGANSVDAFWQNICHGIESVTFFSDQELLAAGVPSDLLANPNYVKAAPILRDAEMFDAAFFGFSPKEAALMDPQHRLFLEVSWEALESAGYDPYGYRGTVGVVSACGGVVSSYLIGKAGHPDLSGQTASAAHISNDKDFLSTRVSFKLNLRGPSFTIQSACSSSLLAVHQACQMLRLHECDMMLAGASTVRVPQVEGYIAEKRNLYSLDGHCRPFDANGQGTIFGSGVGAVLLKPIATALADRDRIIAVIKGTAANNDGSGKISYTAPSVGQQSQAVTSAIGAAGTTADRLGYIECHSTGTIVGDPLEIEALSSAFRRQTERKQFCAIGSLKANIGHPEQAAGIAGIIKTALVLQRGQIPPSINCVTPNPRIDFAASPFYVNTQLQEFPAAEELRQVGLNSLGIGGTNAFAVLEEAPGAADVPSSLTPIAILSAKTPSALGARVRELLTWLDDNPDTNIEDVCYTTCHSRGQFAYRFAACARTVPELKRELGASLQSADASKLNRADKPAVAFMFSGQGPQHAGMARELYRTRSVFRTAMDECDRLAKPYLERGLLEVIFSDAKGEDALVNRTDYTQPALFAVEYALSALLKSWGITPAAVIGHSLGEITAAYVAGMLSVQDAMRLAIARGALMHQVPTGGAMAAVWTAESDLREVIDTVAPGVTVAAMNGPLNTVVSGDRDELARLLQELGRRGVNYRELRISNGFHSPRTDPILDDLEQVARTLSHSAPKLPVISNVTGSVMREAPDGAYWRRHTREPVRFGEGMSALSALDCRCFVEVGPHPVLLPFAQACLGDKGKSAAWIGTLHRQKPDTDAMAEMLCALYRAGHAIDWGAVHSETGGRRIPLPTYPFERKRHWLDNKADNVREARHEAGHPLLGALVSVTGGEIVYESAYSLRALDYLADHRVDGDVVLPTTVEIEAIAAAGRKHFGVSEVSLEQIMHHHAMAIGDEDRRVRVVIKPLKSDRASVTLLSAAARDPDRWTDHLTCTLSRRPAAQGPALPLSTLLQRCATSIPHEEAYARLHRLGLQYGPQFRGIQDMRVGQSEALARVRLPEAVRASAYAIHPAFLDACLHTYPFVIEDPEAGHRQRSCYLPISLERFWCEPGLHEVWVHTRLRALERDCTQCLDIGLHDAGGRVVGELRGLRVRLLPIGKLAAKPATNDEVFYAVEWCDGSDGSDGSRASAMPAHDDGAGTWILYADRSGSAEALAKALIGRGECCHLVYQGESFRQQGRRAWTINERHADDHRTVLQQIASDEPRPVRGLAYLWGLDAPAFENLTLPALKRGSENICQGALELMHAVTVGRAGVAADLRVWFVTADAQGAGDNRRHVHPLQACLWGLGRTIALEYPNIWGGLIDLSGGGDRGAIAEALATELLAPDGETQFALFGAGVRKVARFVSRPLASLPAQRPPVRPDASYLIAGGLGMLGASMAKWLIGNGAKHLVLTGRNATQDHIDALFSESERESATIQAVAADISREEHVGRLFEHISANMPPLKGVVHSAGILDDGILARLSWNRFAPLFEPRVYGSWLLHEHTKTMELDFFILNSSLLSVLGSAGQANYTSSAAFLDGLAAWRRARGLPAVSLNWCAWSEGGLATVSGARGQQMWSSLGMKDLAPGRAIDLFDCLMHREVDQIALAVADWPIYASKVGNPPFLSELADRDDDLAMHDRLSARVSLARLTASHDDSIVLPAPIPSAAPPAVATHGGNGRMSIQHLLQRHIMRELGFPDPIDLDRPLNEVGLDSLRSVALANRLEDEIGIPISVTELISGPSIRQLTDHVLELLDSSVSAGILSADRAQSIAGQTGEDEAGSPVAAARSEPAAVQPERAKGDAIDGQAPAARLTLRSDREAGSAQGGRLEAERSHPMPFTARSAAKWLIAPRPTPRARARLFCFPYAGGGLVTFRSWPQVLGDAVEVVAVEPPGRGTRIGETPVDDMTTFVERLLPELTEWLDRPAAFFGHCLGGLTMFVAACALPDRNRRLLGHLFACGARPPHLLRAMGEFEDNLVFDMLLHPQYDARRPAYAQSDEIFADIIRQFDTSAADEMLAVQRLRNALLPTIRAEFGMAYNYIYRPVERFSFPITSFVGDADPWVSGRHSEAWGELTTARFESQLRRGSHFLIAEDRAHILQTIHASFVAPLVEGAA